jgi:hypothetical protein
MRQDYHASIICELVEASLRDASKTWDLDRGPRPTATIEQPLCGAKKSAN